MSPPSLSGKAAMTADITLRARFRDCLVGGQSAMRLGGGIEFLPLEEIWDQFGPAGQTTAPKGSPVPDRAFVAPSPG